MSNEVNESGAVSRVEGEANEDPVYQLFNEIQSEIVSLKKRPPRDFGHFMIEFTGTILPLMRDLSYRVFEHSEAINEVFDRLEGEDEEGTQFTLEDAKKFDLVLQFAIGMARSALESITGENEKVQLQEIVRTAEECLKLVEEGTLDGEGDEEGGDAGHEADTQAAGQN